MVLRTTRVCIRTVVFAVALAGVALGPRLGAQELASGQALSLEQAMAAARLGSHEVRAARARVDAGRARLDQARSYRLPQLRLQEIWTRTDSPADAFGLELNQERFSLADFSLGDPNDPDPIENALTRLEVEVPIYTGGELGGRIRQAELGSEAARRTAAWSEDQAAWGAAEAYIRLAQVRERVALLEEVLETVEAHVELAAAYLAQGLVVRSELLRAEVERARIRELLTEASGQARVAAAALAFEMGEPETAEWLLDPLPEPPGLKEPLAAWLASSGGRSDLEAAREQLAAGRLEERISRSARLPKIGLLARHDRYDESLLGSSGDSTSLVAVASIDLFSGGRHDAAAMVARSEADAAELDVERFVQGVRLEVRDAFERAQSARERRATAAAGVTAAREAERITRQRFENGVAKTLDVLDALTARREAETRELVARSDAHLASLKLALAAGRRPETGLAPASSDSSHPTLYTDENGTER